MNPKKKCSGAIEIRITIGFSVETHVMRLFLRMVSGRIKIKAKSKVWLKPITRLIVVRWLKPTAMNDELIIFIHCRPIYGADNGSIYWL